MNNFIPSEISALKSYLNSVAPIPQEEFDIILPYVKRSTYSKGDYLLKHLGVETKLAFVVKGIVHQYVSTERRS